MFTYVQIYVYVCVCSVRSPEIKEYDTMTLKVLFKRKSEASQGFVAIL